MTKDHAADLQQSPFLGSFEARDIFGTWSLVSITHTFPDGHIQNSFGHGDGLLILQEDGRFCQSLIRADLPHFVSANRNIVTPNESKSIVQGSLNLFGTFSVDERHATLTFHIGRSSFPNWNGADQKRTITSLSEKELRITASAATVGARGEQVWTRES